MIKTRIARAAATLAISLAALGAVVAVAGRHVIVEKLFVRGERPSSPDLHEHSRQNGPAVRHDFAYRLGAVDRGLPDSPAS
jgi:hypothetical protein